MERQNKKEGRKKKERDEERVGIALNKQHTEGEGGVKKEEKAQQSCICTLCGKRTLVFLLIDE